MPKDPRITELMKAAIAIVGSQVELARRLGVKQPSVNRMLHRGRVSPQMALKLEKLTQIPRARWRPDIFQ